MRAGTLAFLMGNLFALYGASWCVWPLLILPLLAVKYAKPILPFLICCILGYAWTCLAVSEASPKQIAQLFETTQTVIGRVVSIPKRTAFATQFDFKVDSIPAYPSLTPFKIRVAWYHNRATVKAGERWQFKLRLKKPHGFMNPGGFDYERYLLSQHVQARAYVKKTAEKLGVTVSLPTLRQVISDKLKNLLAGNPFLGIIEALAIGNSHSISKSQWQTLRATGTNHLVAISGLHIGLMAAMAMSFVSFLWRRSARAMILLPAHTLAGFVGILAAVCYAALAGFSTSTVRALLMLIVVGLMRYFRRHQHPWQALQTALILVLVIDPLATLSLSFWLSFMAVAWILYANVGYLFIHPLMRTQWAVTLGLVPLSLYFFGQVALFSILANLIAIPMVAMVIVPIVLLATFLLFAWPSLAAYLFQFAAYGLQLLWWYFTKLQMLPFSVLQISVPSTWILVSFMLAVALILSPKAFRLRQLSLIFLLPMALPSQLPVPNQAVRLSVLDVGQGTSVLIETAHHQMLYDTGPKFSTRFNAGEAVILPLLHHDRLSKLDKVIISHGDNDHIGGLKAIQQAITIKQIQSSVPNKIPGATVCLSGETWEYDGVQFEYIYPDKSHLGLNNNSSCVLLITAGQFHALLTGDIEAMAEAEIAQLDLPSVDVLLAPHHGSKTSSTQAFLDKLQPRYVVMSLGFANRFHFPHRAVLARYQAMKSEILRTDKLGAIQLLLNAGEEVNPVFSRQ